jgi:subtilisin
MPASTERQQYVLLPTRGLRASAPTAAATVNFLRSFPERSPAGEAVNFSLPQTPGTQMRLLDQIAENGAKLVEMSSDALVTMRANHPGIRVVPVVYYRPAVVPQFEVASKVKAAAGVAAVRFKVSVVSKSGGTPIAGATVVAFTNFAARTGAQGTTNSQGQVSLGLGGAARVERLYIYPEGSFWGGFKRNVPTATRLTVRLTPISLSFVDGVRHFYGNAPDSAGSGLRVAVVDSGVATDHPDLRVDGGLNTVTGENPGDFGDNATEGHGTHVAGIIAARGTPPQGIRGIAPGVTLRSYRVFGRGADSASNFAIAKAIDAAVGDQCDLINMSLGGGPSDPATEEAIADARAHGCVVIIAAGNDGRQDVSFPGADSNALAISALGRKGTFPSDAVEAGDVASPFGADTKNFIAAFSNIGPEIDLTGPGVGIISTVPGRAYQVMSGTSMACPAVTGFAARALSGSAALNLPRDQDRSNQLITALLARAADLGFGPAFVGKGLPQ